MSLSASRAFEDILRRGGQPIDAVIAACMAVRVYLADETVPTQRPEAKARGAEVFSS